MLFEGERLFYADVDIYDECGEKKICTKIDDVNSVYDINVSPYKGGTTSMGLPVTKPVIDLTCDAPTVGRKVRISHKQYKVLTICEIEIYGEVSSEGKVNMRVITT